MLARLALACALQGTHPIDLPRLLAELADRSTPARFPEPLHRMRSAGGLDAGAASVSSEPRVIHAADGPGAITRIESAGPGAQIRVHVDDDPVGFVLGSAATDSKERAPLWQASAEGYVSLMPIPFARRVSIAAASTDAGNYTVEWRAYPSGTRVTSFARGDLQRHAAAIERADAAMRSSHDVRGEATHVFHLSRSAPEGELLASDPRSARGPRAVSEVRLRVDAADRVRALRACALRMSFDGHETVAVPLGALFGAHEDFQAVDSWLHSVTAAGELVARYVMPYRESFDLRVDNAGDPDLHISASVRTIPWAWDDLSLHFHASWRTHPAARRARVVGRGVIVGQFVVVANPSLDPWSTCATYLVDGDFSLPALRGLVSVGADDPELFQEPMRGRTRGDGPAHFGRTDLYDLRAFDAVPFEREFVLDMPLVAGSPAETATCVLYYARPGAQDDAPPLAREPSSSLPKLPYVRIADAVELESAYLVSKSPELVAVRRTSADSELSSGLQLCLSSSDATGHVEFEIPVLPGRRTLRLLTTRADGDGELRVSIDGREVARTPTGPGFAAAMSIALGEHAVGDRFRLRVEYARASSADAGSPWRLGLDAIVVR